MLKKKAEKANYNRPKTLVGESTTIKTGTFESEKSVQVNGKVIANMIIKESLVVGEEGFIEGEIKADFVLVAGKVVGNIYVAKQIHLVKTASIVGDIDCPSIIIDDGAKIEGKFHMKKMDIDIEADLEE